MPNAPESEKASRYIQHLDDARCAGRWSDVPELCRKIEKHAPHRKCLTLTARSEAQVAAYSAERPSTANATGSSPLSQIIPSLLSTIEGEGDYVQDAFQATICLGWVHYVLDEPGLAAARLPKDFAVEATKLSADTRPLSNWTRVCIVKGSYLKGSALEKAGSMDDAMQSYASILPFLSSTSPVSSETLQFKLWTEQLLVRLCQLSDQTAETGDYIEPDEALQAFRFWAKYWEGTIKSGGSDAPNTARARRLAWRAYYNSLSMILQHDYEYIPESAAVESEKSTVQNRSKIRLQQRAELKRVETIYESLLLKETHFPKASETNYEIEAWVDSVVDNWRLLCGPTWADADLGEGGKEAVGRGVLDILYRAATKTFHSTQILRHLFIVHASLAEFELAFQAHDSYVNIITRGKDRAEKSGEEETDIDDDSTILRTSAEAIRLHCRFGSRKESEKALEIGHHIEKWLEQTEHIRLATADSGSVGSVETLVEPQSLAVAYCAIGISLAQWARFTYEADARASLQAKSIQYFRKSLSPGLGDFNNIETLYALALVLAETRDIPGAIKVAKRALSTASKNKGGTSVDGMLSPGLTTEFGRERKLIAVWHLLALLLTSRSEFLSAEKACEVAFEQFGDHTILFGKDDTGAFRSEHLNDVNGNGTQNLGIVDQMDSFEKAGIIQIKMTQLSLIEVVDGANAAVDGSDELLALYARLFGDPAAEKPKLPPPTASLPPPKSAVGTIRGSIFRGRGSIKSAQRDSVRNSSVPSSAPSTSVAPPVPAPAIQVTGEDGTAQANDQHHHHLLHHHRHSEEQTGVQRTPSKLRKRSAASLRRRSELETEQAPEVPPLPEGITNGTGRTRDSTVPTRASTVRSKSSRRPSIASSIRKSVESTDRPLRPVAHNMSPSQEPPPSGHSDQPPRQDVRLPAPFPHQDYIPPGPRFSKIQERRQKVTLLVSIWIFISGLYTRAEMHEDAREAVGEAFKLVETFEAEVSIESATSKAFADRGWGGGKSVEELWADAYSARGELLVSESFKHKARADFERALLHFPDHPGAVVGLSNILLDIYCKVIPLEPGSTSSGMLPVSPPPLLSAADSASQPKQLSSTEVDASPPELNRLAARDRAYGLLSTLTKLGAGWDFSEAWYTLSRAYEESGQIEKAKEVLWWCVELEDTRPLRSWKSVTLGGFVL